MTNRWAQGWAELIDDGTPALVRRLVQGRNLVTSGRVTGLQIGRGTVTGSVQGHSATPLAVEIAVPVLDDEQWQRVAGALASQVRHRARLLAGQVPDGLDSQLESQGLSLLPAPGEPETTCRCSDQARFCAHAAGVWLAMAVTIEEDPFALLRVRGRGRERLLAEIVAARGGAPPGAGGGGIPVSELAGRDWVHTPVDPEDLVLPAADAPRTAAGPLRLLGDPPGWAGGVSAGDVFAPLVQRGADWASALLADPDAPPPHRDDAE